MFVAIQGLYFRMDPNLLESQGEMLEQGRHFLFIFELESLYKLDDGK